MSDIAGIRIPDSKMAHEITELIRDVSTELLFHHSTRVFFWGALTGERRKLRFDPELLYAGAMFHDVGLTERYRTSMDRFEVNGANAARDFLHQHGVAEASLEVVWDAVALLTAGVEMDVLGIAYDEFSDEQRQAVTRVHPRGDDFKHDIIKAFYGGMRHRPDSTFGTVNDDVLAFVDPSFKRTDFCEVILGSKWPR